MRIPALLFAVALVGGCSGRPTTDGSQARVRNQPPASCTQADFAACTPPTSSTCDPSSEGVIDYGSDCCAVFSCQPLCAAPGTCAMKPAPTCPTGTRLHIGTSLTDCCPSYSCVGVNGGCTAASYDSSKGAACQSVLPYCGPGVAAISVGEDDSCCPVYQCPPCVTTTPANGAYDGGAGQQVPATSAGGGAYCDCTFPTCSAGTQVLCTGAGHCGYPCECVAAVANCTTDADCPSDMYCAVSTSLDVPGCDPTTTAPCVGAGGGGVCTGRNVQSGCAADTDCPTGQRCQLDCASVGCAHADASVVCCDPATDSSCHCDASGNCTTLACTGQCLPLSACESGAAPAANCPADPMPCTDAVQAGLDPTTCCPIYQCPSNCAVQLGTTCPVTTCTGGVTTGTDSSCCPIVACPCTTDADCVSGQSCVSGTCQ